MAFLALASASEERRLLIHCFLKLSWDVLHQSHCRRDTYDLVLTSQIV